MMLRMNLYQRYLVREISAAIFLVLLAFLVLFSFFDFIDELRSVGRENYGLLQAVSHVVLGLPGLIYELIPIAALIGTLYALSTLARHSELTVLRASGLATRDLLLTLGRAALMLAALAFVVGEFLVPVSERLAQEIKNRALSKVVVQGGLKSGVWLKDGRNFINIQSVLPDARLRGVRIYRFDEQNALASVTEAASATFDPDGQWRLDDVVRTTLAGDQATVDRVEVLDWASAVRPELLAVLTVSPDRMSLFSLWNYYQHLADNRQKTDRYEIALWKKLIYPLSTLVMVALALPFGYAHSRIGGVSLKIFTGVMLGIGFYMLNGLFSNLGVINAWPPFASAVTPSAAFMLLALGMLWWAERR